MAISQTLIEASRWASRGLESVREALQGMVEPFTLESLYPEIEEEDENGEFVTTRRILPHQLKIHNPPLVNGKQPDYILHSGGYGSGKSINCSVEVIRLARRYPGIKIVVVCGYDYYFDEFVWPTFEKILPFDSPLIRDMNVKNRTVNLTNGSQIRFKAYDDAQKVKGWEAHIIWIEEGSELGGGDPYKALGIFNALQGRLRAKGKFPRHFIISQNPKGHNYLWKLFIKDSPDRYAPKITWIEAPGTNPLRPEGICFKEYSLVTADGLYFYCVTSGTRSNTNLPVGYEQRMMMSYDEDTRRRFIEGDFNPINTLVYDWPIYSVDIHVIEFRKFLEYWELDDSEAPEIPSWWKVIVGIDVGGPLSPWAAEFYVVTPEDEYGVEHLICFDELYIRKAGWKEVADAINAKIEKFENVTFYIDPKSGPKREGPNQTAIVEEFQQYGIHCQLPRFYTKQAGSLAVKSLMERDKTRSAPYKNDDRDETGEYSTGGARLYYLRDNSWIVSQEEYEEAVARGDKAAFPNPHGYACPANIKEKEVWRFQQKKQREGKEAEEGLTPPVQEKFVDSDDHAQTGEIFAVIGYAPLRKGRDNKKRHQEPMQPYDGRMRRP